MRGPINLAAMDSIFSTLIRSRKPFGDELAQKISDLLNNEDYREVIFFNTSDNVSVVERLKLAQAYLK